MQRKEHKKRAILNLENSNSTQTNIHSEFLYTDLD